jgi:general secretion pathway protein D
MRRVISVLIMLVFCGMVAIAQPPAPTPPTTPTTPETTPPNPAGGGASGQPGVTPTPRIPPARINPANPANNTIIMPTSPVQPFVGGNRNEKRLPKLRQGQKFDFDFRGTDIDHVLSALAQMSGLTVIKSPQVTGTITIINPDQVTIDEALDLLNSELAISNFTAVRDGQILKVLPIDQALRQVNETYIGRDPEKVVPGNQLITQIVPLVTLNADELVGTLAPFSNFGDMGGMVSDSTRNTLYITDTATTVKKLLGLINQMEERSAAGYRLFNLKYISADDMASLLQNVIGGSGGTAGGAARPDFLRNLTPGRTTPGRNTNQPGRTPASPFPNMFAGATSSGGMQITTDARTNNMIIISSPERVQQAVDLIAEFDRPVEYASTLTVIKLKHARVDDIAQRLAQAFGGTATTNAPGDTSNRAGSGGTGSSRSGLSGGSIGGGNTNRSPFQLQDYDAAGTPQLQNLLYTGDSGGIRLAQATGTSEGPAIGRNDQGRIVPLIEANDILVVGNPADNSLIINASPEKLALIRQIIDKLDIEPIQVLIKAVIVEVNLTKQNQLGFEYEFLKNNVFHHAGVDSTLNQNFGLQAKDSSGNTLLAQGLTWSVLRAGDFSAMLNTIATDSRGRVLSTPSIFTTSGKEGIANVSTTVYYPSSTTNYNTTSGIVTNYTSVDVGVILDVIPYVGVNGAVTMDVYETANDLLSYQDGGNGTKLPVIAKRTAQATVTIQDGQTVILGGLMRSRRTSTDTGIPILKDIPLIGPLFRSHTGEREKSELIVFLTPRVVRTAEEAQQLTEQEKANSPSLKNECPPTTPLPAPPPVVNNTPEPAPETNDSTPQVTPKSEL